MKNYFYLLFVLGLNLIYGQEYEADIFVNQKDTLPFRVLLPKNFNPQKFYPLVMVLHGSGERGNDNELQLFHGSSLFQS